MNISYFNFLFILLISTSCGLREKRFIGDYLFPEAYDFVDHHKLILPESLDEISGMTFSPEGKLWAIQDEASIIYELDWPNKPVVRKSKFARNMDVEDVLWTGEELYALKSNGDLYLIQDVFGNNTKAVVFDFPFKGKRDLEALAQLPDGRLLIFCKKCKKLDKDENVASAFYFDIREGAFQEAKAFKLKEKALRKLLPGDDRYKLTVKPSAAALHPIENKLYVLSSVGKWLLIMDLEGEPEALYRISPSVFKQAEGIAFDREGNMYISNEAADGNANILRFNYNPSSP